MNELRFDGLYESPYENEKGSYYIRFYEDGTVLTTSCTARGRARKVSTWLTKENKHYYGKYKLKDGRIVFSITVDRSTISESQIHYEGTVQTDSVSLRVQNKKAFYESTLTYRFKRITWWSDWRLMASILVGISIVVFSIARLFFMA
jgi:hypothetical protein